MSEKVRFGVFGVWRGMAYIKALNHFIDEAEVTAICDMDPEKVEKAKKECSPDVKVYSDFDAMLEEGEIDAVVLCNYFHEHVPYALKALKKGVHVLSECIPASTMKECAELVDAAEQSSALYAFAENYPNMRASKEIRRICQSGILGELAFAEGEYVHPMSVEESDRYAPTETHWRRLLPRTYYLSHSLAPLMAATELMPKRVITKIVPGKAYQSLRGKKGSDGGGIMLVEMDGGVVFRISGSCCYGAHGNWYRVCGQKGEIESIRGTDDMVRLSISDWDKDENSDDFGETKIYKPYVDAQGKKALSCGHSGGDYWVAYNFVQDILNNRMPFMNVYRAAAISSVGILGYRSALNDSKQFDIPDWTDREERKKWYDDDLTPFVSEGKPATLRSYVYE